MPPKHKSSDVGISDMPMRGRKVPPISEKVCIYKKKQCMSGSVLYIVLGIHWGSLIM